MNNEWNSEVVTEESNVDITVDQSYNASSENPQSGTAVAEAVGTPVNLVQGSGITLTESSGNVTISATAQGGATPVVQSIATSFLDSASILAELPQGEYLEPGRYQVFFKFGMNEYRPELRFISFGYQVDHADYIQGSIFYPVNIDSNGPFGNNPKFLRTGYVDVIGEGEISGFLITFSSGGSTQSISNLLNSISLSYLKVGDLS